MGSFSETYNDPTFPKVSTRSIQKSEVLQGVIIVQDVHNPVLREKRKGERLKGKKRRPSPHPQISDLLSPNP